MDSQSPWTMDLEHAISFSGRIPSSLYWHPNGTDFINISGGCVSISDIIDPHKQSFLRDLAGNVTCLTQSLSGKYIAAGQAGENSDVIVWGFGNQEVIYRIQEHYHGVSAVAFSMDERFLATVGDKIDKKIFVWDLLTGNIVASAQVPEVTNMVWGGRVKDVKGRPTTHYQLATTTVQNGVLLWDLDPATGELVCNKARTDKYKRTFTCVSFSIEGTLLFAGSETGDVSIFNTRTKTLNLNVPVCAGGVHSITIGANDEVFVGGGDGTVTSIQLQGKEYVDMKRAKLQGNVTSLSLSYTGEELLAGTAKGSIYRIRVSDFKSALVREAHAGPILKVEFPQGASDRFVTISNDGDIIVWDTTDYSILLRQNVASDPLCVAYGDDCLLVGYKDGSIRAFNPSNGESMWDIANTHKDGCYTLKLAHNQKFVVSAGFHGELRVWELRTRRLITNLKEHVQCVGSVALFDDNCHIVSCSRDRRVMCWDLQGEKRLSAHKQRMGAIHEVALTVDQTTVLTVGQERTITFWDLRQTHPIKIINLESEATSISMSHSGNLFATGSVDEKVRLWDVKSGRLLVESDAHSAPVNSVRFSADDQQVVSVGDDGAILVWNIYNLSK